MTAGHVGVVDISGRYVEISGFFRHIDQLMLVKEKLLDLPVLHFSRYHTADHVREDLPKVYSRELVELIFVQPYCRIGNLVESGIGHRETASKYLKDLASHTVNVCTHRERLYFPFCGKSR